MAKVGYASICQQAENARQIARKTNGHVRFDLGFGGSPGRFDLSRIYQEWRNYSPRVRSQRSALRPFSRLRSNLPTLTMMGRLRSTLHAMDLIFLDSCSGHFLCLSNLVVPAQNS